MSAFGRRNGGMATGGTRTGFGVARPMQGGQRADTPAPAPAPSLDQFPPLDSLALRPDDSPIDITNTTPQSQIDAMQRLSDRQNASGEAGNSRVEGFEASIHKIKEQVLPRLLERVDPEAAATLG